MNTSKVEICGVNTALLPVLNEEQKTQLLLAAKAGNSEARAQMIQGNLRLVLSVVQKFAGRGENLDDLFQVGCIGLIKAIDNFDPGLKVRFSTYGVPMILGEIRRFLRDNTPIRVSRSVRDLAYHAMQAREALQKETGREPRVSEIAARVGSAPEQVAMALESIVEPASLYEPAYTDGDDTLAIMDRVQEASCEESWISDIMFKDTVQALTPRERRIMPCGIYPARHRCRWRRPSASARRRSAGWKMRAEPHQGTNLLPVEPSHVHHSQPQHIPWSKGDGNDGASILADFVFGSCGHCGADCRRDDVAEREHPAARHAHRAAQLPGGIFGAGFYRKCRVCCNDVLPLIS